MSLLALLVPLLKEYLGLDSINRTESDDRRKHYFLAIYTLVFILMSISLVLVTFRAVANAEALISYRQQMEEQLLQCKTKIHQDDSLDSGNGLDPRRFGMRGIESNAKCTDYWCK